MKEIKDFYDAWWFLFNHKIFTDRHGDSKFEHCLDTFVAKVNPLTNAIDDDDSLNTKSQVWFEIGPYDRTGRINDLELKVFEDTYELAILKLANSVLRHYGE